MPMNAAYRGPADLPATIPVFPLPGALLLPRGLPAGEALNPRFGARVRCRLTRH